MKRAVFNQKGGVGKSSISVNLAAVSAQRGLKTLLVDLDVQGNSSHYLGFDEQEGAPTVADLLKQTVGWLSRPQSAAEFVYDTQWDNLCLLPASQALSQIERDLESRYKIFKLREALDELMDEFDRIYIDTPPNLNFYAKSALIAADSVIIPFDCDSFSAQAIHRLLDNVLELKNDHNPALMLEGIVVNQFNPQAKLPRELVAALKAQDLPVLETLLTSSVKMRESHQLQRPLIDFAANHKLTGQLVTLFEELEAKSLVLSN
ncbi:ParA family protein [Ferrimonas marina]|uniref:Chromosome partitioning protein n=1 Tax=Ferrimonas marina TaxID=299255 RepID=A0A1M5ZFW3_9GAMM|nr:ParA family protein [Ferrimonas marina]SHI23021.1 chromosome partitioning protein [Ferrimonas marina]